MFFLFIETEIIEEFTEPVAVETTEVGLIFHTSSCFCFLLSLDDCADVFNIFSLSLSCDTFQFVNRQFLQDGAYTSGEKEQRDEWTPETEVGTFSSRNYY